MNILKTLLFCFTATALVGCASIDPKTLAWQREGVPGTWHATLIKPPPKIRRVSIVKKLNPIWWLGNTDSPYPPPRYRPGKKFRLLTWYGENTFHNFDFYVIGIADRETVRTGKYPEHIGNPNGGWNYAVTSYKRRRLPFIAYNGRHIEWYIGWRERGNFGIALRSHQKKD